MVHVNYTYMATLIRLPEQDILIANDKICQRSALYYTCMVGMYDYLKQVFKLKILHLQTYFAMLSESIMFELCSAQKYAQCCEHAWPEMCKKFFFMDLGM